MISLEPWLRLLHTYTQGLAVMCSLQDLFGAGTSAVLVCTPSGWLQKKTYQSFECHPQFWYWFTVSFYCFKGRGHFIDRHYWDLIKVILMVDPVLDDLLDEKLLTQDQFNKIMKMATSQRKMVKLSETINKWKHTQKDKVYLALRQHNYHSIRPLEILEEKRATSLSSKY